MQDKNIKTIIVDATETPIERPEKQQQKHYSGKKKHHTIKTQLIIEENIQEKSYLFMLQMAQKTIISYARKLVLMLANR